MTQILVRRGTAAAWANANPILGYGEPVHERDTGNVRFGDGVTRYLDLPVFVSLDRLEELFAPVGSGGGGSVDPESVRDTVAAMIAAGNHQGISFIYDDAADKLSAIVTAVSPEVIQDAAATLFTHNGHTNMSFTYDDAGNRLVGSVTLPPSMDYEAVQDAAASLFVNNPFADVIVNYDDENNRVTLQISTEVIQDKVASMLAHNNHSGINFVYDDPNNRWVATVTFPPSMSTEVMQDTVAAMFSDAVGSEIHVDYDDPNGLLYLSIPDNTVRDKVSGMLAHGEHEGISFTYDISEKRWIATVGDYGATASKFKGQWDSGYWDNGTYGYQYGDIVVFNGTFYENTAGANTEPPVYFEETPPVQNIDWVRLTPDEKQIREWVGLALFYGTHKGIFFYGDDETDIINAEVYGNPSLLLEEGQDVPEGTPAGTLIFRKV
jgi:hypothetical protein